MIFLSDSIQFSTVRMFPPPYSSTGVETTNKSSIFGFALRLGGDFVLANKKIYVSLSDDMVKRIDALASAWGVSRSSYIALVLGQTVFSTEKALNSIPGLVAGLANADSEKK